MFAVCGGSLKTRVGFMSILDYSGRARLLEQKLKDSGNKTQKFGIFPGATVKNPFKYRSLDDVTPFHYSKKGHDPLALLKEKNKQRSKKKANNPVYGREGRDQRRKGRNYTRLYSFSFCVFPCYDIYRHENTFVETDFDEIKTHFSKFLLSFSFVSIPSKNWESPYYASKANARTIHGLEWDVLGAFFWPLDDLENVLQQHNGKLDGQKFTWFRKFF